MKCNQHGCENNAAVLYTWPGQDQAGACIEHAQKAKAVADAIGLYVQFIPITVAAQ